MVQPRPANKKPPSMVSRAISVSVDGSIWVLMAIVMSIIIELAGLFFHWWDTQHAIRLLTIERSYIANIDRYPLLRVSPGDIVDNHLGQFNTDVESFSQWLRVQQPDNVFYAYVLSALNIIKLIILRLIVCLLSLPGYLFVGLAAVVDGLVQRDIRKFTGGHESSYVFHKAKRWIMPSILGTISLYLLLPWAIPPVVMFAPSMIAFGFMLFLSTSRFKKFL